MQCDCTNIPIFSDVMKDMELGAAGDDVRLWIEGKTKVAANNVLESLPHDTKGELKV